MCFGNNLETEHFQIIVIILFSKVLKFFNNIEIKATIKFNISSICYLERNFQLMVKVLIVANQKQLRTSECIEKFFLLNQFQSTEMQKNTIFLYFDGSSF